MNSLCVSTSKLQKLYELFIKSDCGELPSGTEDFKLAEDDGTEDTFPQHPGDYGDNEDFWYLQDNFVKIVEIIAKIKNAGNQFYKAKDYKKATRKYKKACRYIEHLRTNMGSTEDDEEEAIRKVEVPILLNIAAVQIAEKNFNDAIKELDKILEIQEDDESDRDLTGYKDWFVKAYYRRGQCYLGRNDYEMALKGKSLNEISCTIFWFFYSFPLDLTQAKNLEPNDKGILNEFARVKKAKQEYSKKEKQMYSKMFW